jgi:hypothetical protein
MVPGHAAEGGGVEPAGDGATGEGRQAPFDAKSDLAGELLLDQFEEQADLLTGLLMAATDDCRARAAAERQSIKGRFTGRQRRDQLEAACRRAAAELQGTLAALRRDYGSRRGSLRRTGRRRPRGGLGLAEPRH